MEQSKGWILVIFLALVSAPAYGYVDPGSGHFFLQLIAAAFVGTLFYVRRIWNCLRTFTKTRKIQSSTRESRPLSQL